MAWAPMVSGIIALHGEHGRNDDNVETDQVAHSVLPHELPQALMSDPEWNDTSALVVYLLLGWYRRQGKSTENT
ncbi:hypothetical protein BPOR_0100g00180 [Botrytis porri]|uniref:Uncharacterized protein n=1 Tax=Botrytis porri TaxID=87229 RepID=A0A4Z1KYV0_9HELO|nr:hypothetical protein BPOR_0100g00180 [Botrytis porri]